MLEKATSLTSWTHSTMRVSSVSNMLMAPCYIFLKHDFRYACHLKWLMVCFEHLSRMKINYNKSDMTPMNLLQEESQTYSRIFCCKLGSFLFKYLGSLSTMRN
jgi:hypothetical protein